MITITDGHGNLLPAFRNILNLFFLTIGLIGGWFGHANWSLRGEADQLVKDAKVVREIEIETDANLIDLHNRIEEKKNEELDPCFRKPSPNNYFDELRGEIGEERY